MSYQQAWPISTYGPTLYTRGVGGRIEDCEDCCHDADDCQCDCECCRCCRPLSFCCFLEMLACCWICNRQESKNDAPRHYFHHLRPSHVVVWVLVALCSVLLLTSFTEEQFQLNPGETRQVPSPNPFFYRAVLEQSWTKVSKATSSANVYYYPSHGCPSLAGPRVKLESSTEMALGYGDYEYDYFYLNPGTTVTITMTVATGALGVYMLQGKDTFDSWAGGNDFVAKPILKGYITQATSPITYEYNILHADVYYIGYDNPHKQQSQGWVDIDIDASSYDVSSQYQIQTCQQSSYGVKHCCVPLDFGLWRNDCIIIQATSSSSVKSDCDHRFDSSKHQDNQNSQDVTIALSFERRWSSVAIVVGMTVVVFAVWCRPSTPTSETLAEIDNDNSEIIYYAPYPPPEYNPYYHDENSTPISSPLFPRESLPPPIPVVHATLVDVTPIYSSIENSPISPIPSAPSFKKSLDNSSSSGGYPTPKRAGQ